MGTLTAGVARANITPPVGSNTWGKPAEGIAGELFAKALVLSDGLTKAVLVTMDLIHMRGKVLTETRRRIEEMTGIPGRSVMLAASHTHCTPDTSQYRPGRDSVRIPDPAYLDQLALKIAGAVAEADSRLVEVKIGVGEGHAPFNINRWVPTPDGPRGARWAPNPDGPIDETLSVLRIDRTDGTPLAAVVNYAAHASVMSWGKYFCADYPGFLQEALEKVYDGEMTAMFVNGASGDLKIKLLEKAEDGSDKFAYGGVEDARRWGRTIAGVALSVLEQIETSEQNLQIGVSSSKVALPICPLPSADEVAGQLEAGRAAGENTEWEEWVLPLLRDGTAPTTVVGEVQLLRLGDEIALVAVPGELYVEIGLRMKRELPFKHLFIAGYANHYLGYLPSASSCRQDGARSREGCHRVFLYPARFSEGVEPTLVSAAKELAGDR